MSMEGVLGSGQMERIILLGEKRKKKTTLSFCIHLVEAASSGGKTPSN